MMDKLARAYADMIFSATACLIVKTHSFTCERGLFRLPRKTSLWRRVRSGYNAFG